MARPFLGITLFTMIHDPINGKLDIVMYVMMQQVNLKHMRCMIYKGPCTELDGVAIGIIASYKHDHNCQLELMLSLQIN